jgi:outer membrane PBP1 activator LpoA protein
MLLAVAAVAAALVLQACSHKEPATRAVDAAEDALAAVAEDSQKYIPQRYAEVKAELDAARAALAEEKYADALAAVQDIPAKAQGLAEEANAAREKLAAELKVEWERLSAALPGTLDGIAARLDELGKLRRLPAGLDADAVERARKDFEIAKSGWAQAAEAFAAGNLEGASARGLEVERLAREIRQATGLEPREPEPAAETGSGASPHG